MPIEFTPPRVAASLGLSGLSLLFLKNAKLDDEAVAERLREQGVEPTEAEIEGYRHRSLVYSAVVGGLAPLAYYATKE